MKHALAGTVVAVLLLFARPVSAQEPAYEILLHRPTKVGTRFHVVSNGREVSSRRITSEGKVVEDKKDDVTVDLAASFTVLELEPQGRASKVMFSVESFTLRRGTTTTPLLGSGTLVVASVVQGEEIFTIGGKRAAPDIDKALSHVVSLPASEKTDDEIFGTRERKRIGESWPINAKTAARAFSVARFKVDESQISGETTLKGVSGVGADKVLDLDSWIEMKRVDVPLPDGFKTVEGRLRMTASAKLPIARERDVLEETSKMSIVMKAVGRAKDDGPLFTIEGQAERTHSTKYTRR